MYFSGLISASIVLFNTNIKQLRTVIDSFGPSEKRILYLIDNSLTPMHIVDILGVNDAIYYYFVGSNKGYGAGHNIGIKMAIERKTAYHIILNPDLKFEPAIIDDIIEFMNGDEQIAQVMPKIISPQGELQYLCKLLPTPFDLLFKRFLPKKLYMNRSVRFQLKFTGYNIQMNVPFLSGCFMFFRTSALEIIGGFDERFFMYTEDIDITRRMHKVYKTIYFPAVSVVHAHAAESYKNIKMFLIHIINGIRYFNKWGWLFDYERGLINKRLLKELGYYGSPHKE